jgi:subtilisin family serine protease
MNRFSTPQKWIYRYLLHLAIAFTAFALIFPAIHQYPLHYQEKVTFLNDRSAAITGATPLAARGFLRPEGLTGAGQVVALADSGLGNGQMDDPHPDLRSQPGQMPKVIMLSSWAGREKPDDPNGHGTHMAATIAGTGAASNGKFAGLAPGASIYFQAILNSEGKPSPPADIARLFQPAYAAAARIHVNGWGGKDNAYLPGTAQIDAFIRQHPDFLVIFGAGNGGPQQDTLTPEANSKNALVVGASEGVRPAFGPNEDNATQTARFSSRGPTPDGRTKPDLVAPGSGIISAASPLIKSNFAANPLYTRMQGTSMATAVTGGAAALLREYFQKEENLNYPSSALLKAALVNGAQPIPGDGAGYGRLDLAGTVLALKEKSFLYQDKQDPLFEGENRSYTFSLTDQKEPLVATLAWIDPPAVPGGAKTLVNDLDLIVTAPGGRTYLGNDNYLKGNKDDQNNIERVVIPAPQPGTYTVEVKADKLARGLKPGASPAQDFALVFGQPPAREIVSRVDENSRLIKFASGRQISMPATGKNVLGRYLTPWELKHVFPGESAYLPVQKTHIYLNGDIWHSQSTEILPLSSGALLLEADPAKREGGFYLNPRLYILANGRPIDDLQSLPGGIQAFGLVNPSSQTIWWLKTDYVIEKGVLREIDIKNRRVLLFGRQESYPLAEEVAFSFNDSIVNSSREDLPFGAPALGTLEQLAPGMSIRLVSSPLDGKVQHIAIGRSLATGELSAVDANREQLVLKGGKSYQVITNSPATIDGSPVQLNELKPGQHVILILAGETVISIIANSTVNYGQVVYFSKTENKLYFLDYRNHLRTLEITPQVQFFRWQQASDPDSLMPGEYVRLALAPGSKDVCRLDAADALEEQKGTFSSFDRDRGRVFFLPAGEGLVSSRTMIVKNGYPVKIEDILPGEEVSFTLLKVPASNENILATVKAGTKKEVTIPRIEVACRSGGENIFLSGITNGDYVYVYPEQGPSMEIKPETGGRFALSLKRPEGKILQLVTVNRRTGGVAGMYVTIPEPASFGDIAGHPVQKEVETLAREGLLSGYPDGSFRPDQPVTRAEFSAMITRVIKLTNSKENERPVFADQLPSWAQHVINLAFLYGIISGYPDGSFYANQPVTWPDAVSILTRVLEKNKNRLSDPETAGISSLAARIMQTVSRSNSTSRNYSGFSSSLSRAEAILIMRQLQEIIPDS